MTQGQHKPVTFNTGEPTIDQLLNGGGLSGFQKETAQHEAGQALLDEAQRKKQDLLKNYTQVFSSPAGQAVLEDLLNMTLRAADLYPGGHISRHQQIDYLLERRGQNGIVTYILGQIKAGQQEL